MYYLLQIEKWWATSSSGTMGCMIDITSRLLFLSFFEDYNARTNSSPNIAFFWPNMNLVTNRPVLLVAAVLARLTAAKNSRVGEVLQRYPITMKNVCSVTLLKLPFY